ncbi:MAG TPA: GTP-binding protein [Kofleriaceae bacterium]|jgi:G3E family GTPase|nr:GTP-binding protein [Kofleriaceae bacterium]
MKVPFTILTGWLGAGKTTALNRLLAAPHGKRIAVLVNELGRISIDTQLIVGRGGDVLELAGGCVCCKVDIKNDLWEGIADIARRSHPDHIVLETTGIAEPAMILESLNAPQPLGDGSEVWAKRAREQAAARDAIAPAGVVCVVDAESGANALAEREEAGAQVMAADRVLISKLDVASPDAVRATHARLDQLAPHAERAAFPDDQMLAMAAWLLEPRALRAWSRAGDAHEAHDHGNQLIAITFADDVPLVGERVVAVLEALGDRLVRAKGFVSLAGDDRRGFVERAGVRTSLEHRDVWGVAPRRTELVMIGEDLDEAALRRALWACRAG